MNTSHCHKCGLSNRTERRFCSRCGQLLPLTCLNCGFSNLKEENYCGGCGTALTGVQQLPANFADKQSGLLAETSERRQVTILFCDLVDFTRLGSSMDPEALRELVRTYQKRCTADIARCNGRVARYVGDGIMAHFGFPEAREDAAVSAGQAALLIMQSITNINDRQSMNLAVRIGIATGLVVGGDWIGEQDAEQCALVGSSLNLAARLQQHAPGNGVLISENTRTLLAERFLLKSYGPLQLKGFPDERRAWLIIRHRPIKANQQSLGRQKNPIFGRSEELKTIESRWLKVQSGKGQVVILSGDPGIGKSRLIQAVRTRLKTVSVIPITYQCSPNHQNAPLHPFLKQIYWANKLLLLHGKSPGRAISQQILKHGAKRVATALPLFQELMNVPDYQDVPSAPRRNKSEIFLRLMRLMPEGQNKETALIIVEDIHWIDPTSRELLDLMIRHAANAKILMLISFRDAEVAGWRQLGHVIEIPMAGLSSKAGASIIRQHDRKQKLDTDTIRMIQKRADGIPLFLEELTHSVISGNADTEEKVPVSLQDLLMSRLDRMGSAKKTAQIAAATGYHFDAALIAEIEEKNLYEVHRHLKELHRAGLLSINERRGELSYRFRHALVQDVAYQSLLKTQRARIHQRVATILHRLYQSDDTVRPEMLAWQYDKAHDPEKAIDWYEISAKRNILQAAFHEAEMNSSRGIKLLEQSGNEELVKRHAMELHFLKGIATRAIEGFASEATEQSFRIVADLAQQSNDEIKIIEANRGLFTCLYIRGDLYGALKIGNQILDLSLFSKTRHGRFVAHFMLGAINFWQATYRHSCKQLQQSLLAYDANLNNQAILSRQIDLYPTTLVHLAWTQWMLGRTEDAIGKADAAVVAAAEVDQPFTLATCLFWQCSVLYCANRFDESRQQLQRMKILAREHRLTYLDTVGELLLGRLTALNSDKFAGLEQIYTALAKMQQLNSRLGYYWSIAMAIETLMECDRMDEARSLCDTAVTRVNDNGDMHWFPEILRLFAIIEQRNDNLSKARQLKLQAVKLAECQGAVALLRRLQS